MLKSCRYRLEFRLGVASSAVSMIVIVSVVRFDCRHCYIILMRRQYFNGEVQRLRSKHVNRVRPATEPNEGDLRSQYLVSKMRGDSVPLESLELAAFDPSETTLQ